MPNNQYVKIRIVSNQTFHLEQFYNEQINNKNFFCLLKNEKNLFQKLFKQILLILLNTFSFPKRQKEQVIINKNSKENKELIREVNAIIIHFHGGGFVALKSHFHQYYTRIWSKNTSTPIFSIDYSLAPANKYLHWMIADKVTNGFQNIVKIIQVFQYFYNNDLEIKPKKIILIGDSAGGNFALSITFLAIAFGLKKPDCIILAYPALSIDQNKLSPSWLYYGLRNKLLPYSVIKLMLNVYLPDNVDPANDFFISSLLADDELLKQLPPIDIICGDNDPLQDDSWRFYYRLKKLGKTVNLTFFRNIPHGFLNFAVPNGVKIGHYFVKELEKCIQRMINL